MEDELAWIPATSVLLELVQPPGVNVDVALLGVNEDEPRRFSFLVGTGFGVVYLTFILSCFSTFKAN